MPLAGLWLCGYIRRHVWMWPLGMRLQMLGCFMHTFPLFHSMRWYAYHTCLCHSLAFYASLHVCLHVHAWVLLASVSSMLQHNEVMDIRSKPKFVPRGHHLLFAFLLVFLLSCSLVCMLPCSCACHVYHAYLLYASFICTLHHFPSIACLLVYCLCLCMYTHGARTLGARAQSHRHKKKGCGGKHVELSGCVQ